MKNPHFTPLDAAAIEAGLRSAAADPDRMSSDEISLALAHKVPDMARGFAICTTYGAIGIPPGRMADKLARAVTVALQCELLAATKRAEFAKGAHHGC
ncbi:MAG: hypothetical protein A2503_10100 [Burkholderiales bacterium RIFOXYD12_FULL_59_19]|nr:MAG: hypothetical protein A2503_10100 [Burkholderiales bacterium RIFOXYD12_FULL_59_19]